MRSFRVIECSGNSGPRGIADSQEFAPRAIQAARAKLTYRMAMQTIADVCQQSLVDFLR
jgi:hypothetical protein